MRTRLRNRALVGLVLVTTGCYSYVPAELGTVPVGEGVRVYLSREGVARLRELGGDQIPGAASDQPVVQGTLVRRSDADFSLRIPVTSRQTGFLQSELGQQVTLPATDVVLVEQKRVNGVRTGLLVAAGTAAIATVIIGIMTGARDAVPDPDPPSGDLRSPEWVPDR